MLAPSRFSVLACAALAVATLVSAALVAAGHPGEPHHGVGYALLYWPALLLDRLPAFADVLKTSPIHRVLLYFAGYLLAWFVARNLVAAIARRTRPARIEPSVEER